MRLTYTLTIDTDTDLNADEQKELYTSLAEHIDSAIGQDIDIDDYSFTRNPIQQEDGE